MTLSHQPAPHGSLRNLVVCALVALAAGASAVEARAGASLGNPRSDSSYLLGTPIAFSDTVTGTEPGPGDILTVSLIIGGRSVDSTNVTVTPNGQFAGTLSYGDSDDCHEDSIPAYVEVRDINSTLLSRRRIYLESEGGCGDEGEDGP